MRVDRRMRRRVLTIQRDDTVDRAQSLMAQHGIRHLPVLDGETLVGVLSDRDVRGAMLLQRSPGRLRSEGCSYYLPPGIRVDEAMSPSPVSVGPATDIEEAVRLLLERRIGCLPVVAEGRVVGIITETDILWVFSEMMGLLESSSRIDVVLGRSPGAMERTMEIIRSHRGRIISVGMSPARKGQPRVHHFRLKSCDTAPIAAALARAGYRVIERMG